MIFDLECPYCAVVLVPVEGAVWGCQECTTAFEVCGTRLVVRRDVREWQPATPVSGAGRV